MWKDRVAGYYRVEGLLESVGGDRVLGSETRSEGLSIVHSLISPSTPSGDEHFCLDLGSGLILHEVQFVA